MLLAVFILMGPKHADAGQSHTHAAPKAQAAIAAAQLDLDNPAPPADAAKKAGAEHVHGADAPLPPHGPAPTAIVSTTARPAAPTLPAPRRQSGPGAPTPPPRSLQAPAPLIA